MQIFRYMYGIWDDYEREMERTQPGISARKDFKYLPPYLLEIMAKLARALFYSMNIPEDKTEEAVAKIKERGMGRLFEGVTFDYQEEISKMRAAAKAAGENIEEKAEKLAEKLAQEKAEKLAQEKVEKLAKELKISHHIVRMISRGCSAEEIQESIRQEFGMSAKEAEEEYRNAVE